MNITDLPTPSLVLDRARLVRNIKRMAEAAKRHGVALRPHLKTTKSIDVARLALEGQAGGVAVSTLKEAEYFASHGITDLQYAVSIVPDKLARIAAIEKTGARVTVITDCVEVARAIGAKGHDLGHRFHVLVEVDCGEGRSGVCPDGAEVLEIAKVIGQSSHTVLAGVMTHAGHSYGCRSIAEIQDVAEAERAAAVRAALRIRALGMDCPTVSVGSTPTALHVRSLEGVTEVRPGVYMFGDMFQAQIGSCDVSDLAVSVLTQVISHREPIGRLLVDAGALALSKDRSTESAPNDVGFGLVAGLDGRPLEPQLHVGRVYQEHGQIVLSNGVPLSSLPVGSRLRIYPNHVCMTGAMYGEYHVVDSETGNGHEILAIWPRVNGW